MIEEVVNSILEAEDVAKARVEAAESKAAEIVAAAEVQAEQLRRQAAAANKEYFVKSLSQADVAAEREAQALIAKLNGQTDEAVKQLDKRVKGAVKIIVESL